jgi:ATP-binding cassette subfamily B multidrug efflux pump
MLRYNAAYWKAYVAGCLLSLVFVGMGLFMPLVIRWVIAEFEAGTMDNRRLLFYFLSLVGIAVLSGIARYFERLLIINASRKFEYDLRNDYFRHVQTLSRSFFTKERTGDIMARATNDLNYARMFMGPGIMGTIDQLRLPFALGLMIYLSPKLTLITLAPLPILCLFVYAWVMYSHAKSTQVQEKFGLISSRVQENLAGARVVKGYAIADREIGAFRAMCEDYFRHGVTLNVVLTLPWPILMLMISGMVLLVLWKGGEMVLGGTLAIEDFSGFLVCLMLLAWPIAELGWILSLYQRGAAGMKRIIEFLMTEPAITDGPDVRTSITALKGHVHFENVSFAYGERLALEEISFDVPRGETVAIVGPTGSGKTTIISLLTREYDVLSGRVEIDGVDVREIPLSVLRQAMGYVPQETFLFSESIRTNLTFGREDASDEAIQHAMDVAQFRETVDGLENGLDTLLGERGVNLSGGQKQRLAIARAVVRNPQILILDDALSSVDTHTEERILQGLKQVMSTRTTFIISHRISAVRHADNILVIDDGRIVERGHHDELLAEGGVYTKMYERQLLEEELEETV